MKSIEEFKAESDVIIKSAEDKITEIGKLIPFGQMTYEDASYVETDLVLDLENKPSFWPHLEEDYIFDEKEGENPQIEEPKKN